MGSSGHRLSTLAFILTSKIIYDDTYLFALREIGQMEREMCSYLKWQLKCSTSIPQRYGTFKLGFSMISLVQACIHRWYCLSQHLLHLATKVRETILAQVRVLYPQLLPGYPCLCPRMPLSFPVPRSVHTPQPLDTPEASHSASTSPTSSVSPQTPLDAHGPGIMLYRQIRAQSRLLSSPTITDQLS